VSFAELAKKFSTDPSSKDKGGELGFFSKGQMVPAFQAAAFSQPIGVVGPPVKSPFGYHIIVVEERKPAHVATMANSGDKIRKLNAQKQQQQIPLFLQGLRAKAKIDIYDRQAQGRAPAAPARQSGWGRTGRRRTGRTAGFEVAIRDPGMPSCSRGRNRRLGW
jgi:parvulin-like peptidyl-prolyl isomerase